MIANDAMLLEALDAAIIAMMAQPGRTPALSVAIGRLKWHRAWALNRLRAENAIRREDERAIERAGVA